MISHDFEHAHSAPGKILVSLAPVMFQIVSIAIQGPKLSTDGVCLINKWYVFVLPVERAEEPGSRSLVGLQAGPDLLELRVCCTVSDARKDCQGLLILQVALF
jgi:hypothetical protein